MNTEQPHYGNEALRHNDEENWRAYCEHEDWVDYWIKLISILAIGCALCFAL